MVHGFLLVSETGRRKLSWNLLRLLNCELSLTWFFSCDYNELLCSDEKIGGAPRPVLQMPALSDAIQDCGFMDIPVEGPVHTWRHGRDRNMVREGLIGVWLLWVCLIDFLFTKEKHMISYISDHPPIFLVLSLARVLSLRKSIPFVYEAMWRHHPRFKKVISSS